MDFTKKIDEIYSAYNTCEKGLSDQEAKKRLLTNGYNKLEEEKKQSKFYIFIKQYFEFMSIVLFIACLMSFAFGIINKYVPGVVAPEVKDEEMIINFIEGGIIFIILLANGLISAIQEISAIKTLDALKNINAPIAKVFRDGNLKQIKAEELVVGDVVFVDDGSIIPADIRLIETSNLKIQEASLTGESEPILKDALWTANKETLLAERVNMAFSSTIVNYGHGIGVVVATGKDTEIGKIANLLNKEKAKPSHIQKSMSKIGKQLTYVGAIAAVLVLLFGFLGQFVISKEGKWMEPLMLAISLAIAVIPEGLPAMTTILMSMGVASMSKNNAVVKDLPSVETLGSCSCICSDKTGTLTLNKMTVVKIFTADDVLKGINLDFDAQKKMFKKYEHVVNAGVLCNTSEIDINGQTIGDPTESALLKLAVDFKENFKKMRETYTKIHELPFDSDRKMMSTINVVNKKQYMFTKGATESLIKVCTHYMDDKGKVLPLKPSQKKMIHDKVEELSKNALRVLSYAVTPISGSKFSLSNEKNLIFVGMTGMIDPPRKEVLGAVRSCHEAGIKVIMITGDHAITAKAIAKELEIFREGDTLINGDELEKMPEKTLKERIKTATVFSRISPEGKMRIIKALQSNKEITSMTGDGVNDAPSLKAADIGVAMGITGTDVAKSSASVILLDDNFTSIEKAVFEGRRIFRNIQKIIQFLVSGCIAEVLIMIFATILSAFLKDWNEPLNAIQILILNVATDTIPCFALGYDKLDRDAKVKTPRNYKEIFSKEIVVGIIVTGVYFSLISIAAYIFGSLTTNNHDGMTFAFLTLSISQILHTFNMQSNTISIFSKQNQFNKYIPLFSLIALAIVALMVVLSVSCGSIVSKTLGIGHISGYQWAIAICLPVTIVFYGEIYKAIYRRVLSNRAKT